MKENSDTRERITGGRHGPILDWVGEERLS